MHIDLEMNWVTLYFKVSILQCSYTFKYYECAYYRVRIRFRVSYSN